MTKKKSTTFQSIRRFFVGAMVAGVFILPIFATGTWIAGVALGNDPRGIYEDVEKVAIRPADLVAKPFDPFNEPLLSITLDDGRESSYSTGLPIMQRYGVTSTQYVLANEFNNPAYLSEKQIKSYQKYGHEIASHTFSHADLTKADDAQLYKEVVETKQILENKFGQTKDFASPLGAQNDRTINYIKQHYRSQRNTKADPAFVGDEDVNTAANFNRYDIIAYTVRRSTTVEDLARLVNYAIAKKAWVVITYHQLFDDGSEYAVNAQAFEAQMKFLFNKPIRTQNVGSVLDAIEAREKRGV